MPTYAYIRHTNCINIPGLCQRIHTLNKLYYYPGFMLTYTYIRYIQIVSICRIYANVCIMHTLDKQIVSISRVYANVYIHYIYKFYQSFGFMPTFTYKFYQYPGLGLGWVLTKVTNIPFPPRLIFQSRKI